MALWACTSSPAFDRQYLTGGNGRVWVQQYELNTASGDAAAWAEKPQGTISYLCFMPNDTLYYLAEASQPPGQAPDRCRYWLRADTLGIDFGEDRGGLQTFKAVETQGKRLYLLHLNTLAMGDTAYQRLDVDRAL